MNTKRLEDVVMAAFMGMFGILGIVEIVSFLTTWMWHCLLFAAMCIGVVWVWYCEDCKPMIKKSARYGRRRI